MAITWHVLEQVKPLDDQICWVTGGEYRVVFGPLTWSAEKNCFLDVYETESDPYSKDDGLTHWCNAADVNIPAVHPAYVPDETSHEAA